MTRRSRRDEIAANLAAVERRISLACEAAGRPRSDVHLVAVTKTFPAADVRLLAELGITDVGENREPEASRKRAELAELAVRWHFVGGLQRNKVRAVGRWADVVHSVDRGALVTALGRAAADAQRTIAALVQVSLDISPAPGRYGVVPEAACELAGDIATTPGLRLGGVMGIAPRGGDPAPAFERLRAVAEQVRSAFPGATMISAGMSADLEVAVGQGATHLRIGTALLGARATAVG